MTVGEVLHTLQTRDIQLMLEGAQLRYDAPEDAITDEVLTLLRQHKAALLALLAQPPPPYHSRPVGAPFRPGQQVWLYRWDDHSSSLTPR